MSNFDIVFTMASWEPRFRLGLEALVDGSSIKTIVVLYATEYEQRSLPNRTAINDFCSGYNVEVKEIPINISNSIDIWNIIKSHVMANVDGLQSLLLDITTMPREVLWTMLHFLSELESSFTLQYCKPHKYGEWLTRSPDRPRLIYKYSGVTFFGRSTLLFLTTGYDLERTKQFSLEFDPAKMLLAIQTGSQFRNKDINEACHLALKSESADCASIPIDAYEGDHGEKDMYDAIFPYLKRFNIVVSSLGPKPSAVSLFKICKKYPQIALAYVSSKEVSEQYSTGIGKIYTWDY